MHMASDAVNMLMDSASSQASEAIVGAVRKIAGISEVRRVRVRTSGPQSFVDLTVGVAPGLKVSDGHRLAHARRIPCSGTDTSARPATGRSTSPCSTPAL